jgi:uncharacterized protein (UPF0248 family)
MAFQTLNRMKCAGTSGNEFPRLRICGNSSLASACRLKRTGRIGNCRIRIAHRGAPDGTKLIQGADVREVKKSYFTYENYGRETFIPLHRVKDIDSGGKTVWKKKI